MCDISTFSFDSPPSIIPMRKPTQGPELEIVNCFIDAYKTQAKERSWKHDVVILVEPKLNAGYPDLVIIHYDPEKLQDWSKDRERLSRDDLKILSLLINNGRLTVENLCYLSGFKERDVSTSLSKLELCKLAQKGRRGWASAKKSTFFALERVVAIEAKTDNASEALDQALKNTNFASASYVLLGSESLSEKTKTKCEGFGVGAIAGKAFRVAIKPRRKKVPVCLTSLLINELISRNTVREAQPCLISKTS